MMNILVIHPGTQHSTKLTSALKNMGNNVKLTTTVYYKQNSFLYFLYRLLPKFEKSRVQSRKHEQLDDDDVILLGELLGLLLLIVARVDKNKKIYVKFKRLVAKYVGKKAAKYAIKNKYDMVISFDSYAYYPFAYLIRKKSNIIRVLDCSAAYAPAARKTYLDEIEIHPHERNALKTERCVLWQDKYYKEMEDEAYLADKIICASSYTKKTLVDYGLNSGNISVIPYGNMIPVEKNSKNKMRDKKFTVIYVGAVSIMKGIEYLINAFKQIPEENLELILVGNYSEYIKNQIFDDNRIFLKGFVPHNEINKVLQEADLFVFPSLSDGFGYAPLEAMSQGIPCIITRDSGISDIITDGENGFIIDSRSSKQIKERIIWCINNRQELAKIGEKAKKDSTGYSDKAYEKQLQFFVENVERVLL